MPLYVCLIQEGAPSREQKVGITGWLVGYLVVAPRAPLDVAG
jgi:hypothetical protein